MTSGTGLEAPGIWQRLWIQLNFHSCCGLDIKKNEILSVGEQMSLVWDLRAAEIL